MYEFHYNHMCVKYPRADQLRLLFTDTDSLSMLADDTASRYDFSVYPLDHPLHDTPNRKAHGFFKDELNSVPMQEFGRLRPKCYAAPFFVRVKWIRMYFNTLDL